MLKILWFESKLSLILAFLCFLQIREKLFSDACSKGTSNYLSRFDDSFDSSTSGEMHRLPLADWAKLWLHVLQELRAGRRNLRPVGDRIKDKDFIENQSNSDQSKAHELILRYIRSRPALMPVQQRKLGPPLRPTSRSLLDQLHESIRQRNVKLRPVQIEPRTNDYAPVVGRVCDVPKSNRVPLQSSNSLESSPMVQKKKLIKPDISWDFDLDDDDMYIMGEKRYSSMF